MGADQDIRVGDEVLVRAASGKGKTWMRVWKIGSTGKVGVTPGALDPITGFAKEPERLYVARDRIVDVRRGAKEDKKMGTMRQVFEGLVDGDGLSPAAKSTWLGTNLPVMAASLAHRAVQSGEGQPYPKKYYNKLENLLADNGVGRMSAEQLSLFDEMFEAYFKEYMQSDPTGQPRRIFRLSDAFTARSEKLIGK